MAHRFHIHTRTFTAGVLASKHAPARAYTRGLTATIAAARRGVDANHHALAERSAR